MELKLIHDFTVKPLLRTVPGLAEVNSSGGYDKQMVVLPKAEKLRDANLSFEELAATVAENVENAGGGVVNRGHEQLIIRSVGRVQLARGAHRRVGHSAFVPLCDDRHGAGQDFRQLSSSTARLSSWKTSCGNSARSSITWDVR
jgi:multidrug efflux pump subunit AcrB